MQSLLCFEPSCERPWLPLVRSGSTQVGMGDNTGVVALGPSHQIGYSQAPARGRGKPSAVCGLVGLVVLGRSGSDLNTYLPLPLAPQGLTGTVRRPSDDDCFCGFTKSKCGRLLFACSSLLFCRKGVIDTMRRQVKEGGEYSHDKEGALLRKLISIQGSGDDATKGVDDRMNFSDTEILTQVKG